MKPPHIAYRSLFLYACVLRTTLFRPCVLSTVLLRTVYPNTLDKCVQKGVNLIVVKGKCSRRYYGSGDIFYVV